MGSIGQYSGVKDYIYNAHIENVTMLNAQVCRIVLIAWHPLAEIGCRTELVSKLGQARTLATDTSTTSRTKISITSMWTGQLF